MPTLTGILEWPQRTSAHDAPGDRSPRLRQLADTAILLRPDDPVVPPHLCERFNLRSGLEITVRVGDPVMPPGGRHFNDRPHHRNGHHRYGRRPHQGGPHAAPVARAVADTILAIEGVDPARFVHPRPFEELTSIDPQPRLTLEYPGYPPSCRLIDMFCPIGRGQRGLIVSPPKAGKTTLLKDISLAVLRNHPEVEVIVLLVDERPEEVTDFKRTLAAAVADLASAGGQVTPAPQARSRCRVIASSNDHTVERHVAVSTMTMERCKRLVEAGRHVLVLMDSLTRVGRSFNQSRAHATSGRTLTGGLDSKALEVPKMIFGSARNTEEAGSLTMIASCLVDTGSAADQVIFEEFKGTGNMELILDRKIQERRIFPAINLAESGTRKEHLLMTEQEIKTVTALRRRLMAMPPHVQIEQLLAALKRFPTNAALVGSAG